jgi:hypothetical protein
MMQYMKIDETIELNLRTTGGLRLPDFIAGGACPEMAGKKPSGS